MKLLVIYYEIPLSYQLKLKSFELPIAHSYLRYYALSILVDNCVFYLYLYLLLIKLYVIANIVYLVRIYKEKPFLCQCQLDFLKFT